jgi:polyvinyl alcohol dehydrogenase (cytochrome)
LATLSIFVTCEVWTSNEAHATSAPFRSSQCSAVETFGGWSDYRDGPANTGQNAADADVDPRTVGSLAPRWEQSGLVGVTGTPVVSNGVVYFGAETGTVWAITLSTGKTLWSTQVGGEIVGSPAIAGNALYIGTGAKLFRLDSSNGRIVWKTTTNSNPYSQINASPIVFGGRVILGTAQFEEVVGNGSSMTFQGSIGAWSTATGKLAWNFVTTPNNSMSGAGEGVWSTPAIDPKLGLLFVGTGQNISEPTGPLADSLLAIHVSNGGLAWSHQFTNPDVFGVGHYTGKDADIGASPNLWSCHGREMVGVGQKNGEYHALDAKTGRQLWNTKLTPGSTFGGALGSAAFIDGRLVVSSNIGDPSSNSTTNTSEVLALDPVNGNVLWSDHFDGNIFGPVTGVPGVAFVGTDASRLYALRSATGAHLWSYVAPAPVGGGASIVGRYLCWGYGFTLFKGPGQGGIIAFSVGNGHRTAR